MAKVRTPTSWPVFMVAERFRITSMMPGPSLQARSIRTLAYTNTTQTINRPNWIWAATYSSPWASHFPSNQKQKLMKTLARLQSAPISGVTWPVQQRPQIAVAPAPGSNGGTQTAPLDHSPFNKMKSRIKVLLVDDHPV